MQQVSRITTLALPGSLPRCHLVLSPTGNFCQERQKSPKTPFETHGFKTSFPRSTAQLALDFTARQNRREKTSLTCCMATAPPSLVRLPVQNVERCTPTFQSGAAARVKAGTIPDLHQNAVLSKRAAASTALGQGSPCKEGWKPWFPRAFLVTFAALGKSYPAEQWTRHPLRRESCRNISFSFCLISDTQTPDRTWTRSGRPGCPSPPAGQRDRTGAASCRNTCGFRSRRS